MNDEWKELIEAEMQRDLDEVMEEIDADPTLKDVEAPEGMYGNLMEMIDEHEAQEAYEQLSDEDKELIRLGRVYKKQRKWNQFVVALAAVIVGLWLGTVCIGENKNILNFVTRIFSGREQEIVNSDSIEPITYIDENEAFEEIEKTYGFSPVKLRYLPKKTFFLEAVLGTDIQAINMFYGTGDQANILYIIRPSYRESSLGTDIEDEKIQEYQMFIHDVEIAIQEYRIAETNENRWVVSFEYQEIQYLLRITDMEQEEVENIINGLYL